MKRLLFIINPIAGQKRAKSALLDIVSVFSKGGYEVTVSPTLQRGHAARLAKENAEKYDLIVCCGGDGTLNETIEGALESGGHIPVGYIPAGSTNDFAASLSIPKNPVKAAENIVNGNVHGHDVGLLNGENHFVYVASFGAFTETSYLTSQSLKNALGHLAYMLEGSKSVLKIKPIRLQLLHDKGKIQGDFLFGAVANSTSMGGVVKLRDPMIDFNDGLFEVMLIRNPKNLIELQGIINCMLKYEYDERYVMLFRTSHAEFQFLRDMDWSLDGEYYKGNSKAVIENLHGAIHLVY